MIRDPSDGTVRDTPKANLQGKLAGSAVKDSLTTPDTGLRQPTRTDAQERLEESRKWLKKYQQAVRDANSMNDKGEVIK